MAGVMKSLVKQNDTPGAIELISLQISKPGKGEVLIKVKSAAICGTDLHIYQWRKENDF